MNTNPSSGGPQKGLSGLAIAGIGCAGLFVVAGIAGFLLIQKGCQKVSQIVQDSGGQPVKTAAQLAVMANPDLEVVSTDEAKGTMTLRQKSNGHVMTIPVTEAAQGRFSVQDAEGKRTEVSVGNGPDGGGTLTVEGPDGKMAVSSAGADAPMPAWVPGYPGAQTQPGGMRAETPEGISGNATFTTTDPAAKVRQHYETALKQQGFTTEVASFGSGDAETTSITATKNDGKTTVNLVITAETGQTTVMTTYQGPKP